MATINALHRVCLVLTATIQVRDDMFFTQRKDTKTRLEDYKRAFRKWIRTPGISSIVFVENSGFDLKDFEVIATGVLNKQVEFLSFQCPPFDGSLGKGYGEMSCLERCLTHSLLLNASDRFAKVSGRYYVKNADQLFRFIAETQQVDVICNFSHGLTWVDSRAFAGSLRFLRDYFCPMKEDLNDAALSTFEQVLARAVHRLIGDSGRWSMTPSAVEIEGFSGSHGVSWKPSLLGRIKQEIRHKLLLRLT